MFILTEPTLPMAAVRYPALLAMVARLISVLGSPALPAAEMITGGVLARPDSTTGNYYQQTDHSKSEDFLRQLSYVIKTQLKAPKVSS